MKVLQKLDEAIKRAMKSGDTFRLGVMRLIKTETKNKEIDLMRPIEEAEFLTVLTRMVNQRKDSIEQFTKGGRADLADNERREIGIIQEYLPQPLGVDELAKLIAAAIQKTGAQGPQDMGLIMKELKVATAGRVDGKTLSDQVRAALSH
jgi:uncharacterized protein YqeY